MPPADAPVCARPAAPARQDAKVVAALIAGQSIEAIADEDGRTRKRVETAAIGRASKILVRLDRRHGFSKAAPADDAPDAGGRERPLATLDATAKRMIAARKTAP
jgi:hypothetical protein